jgi:hypothetical protein
MLMVSLFAKPAYLLTCLSIFPETVQAQTQLARLGKLSGESIAPDRLRFCCLG